MYKRKARANQMKEIENKVDQNKDKKVKQRKVLIILQLIKNNKKMKNKYHLLTKILTQVFQKFRNNNKKYNRMKINFRFKLLDPNLKNNCNRFNLERKKMIRKRKINKKIRQIRNRKNNKLINNKMQTIRKIMRQKTK